MKNDFLLAITQLAAERNLPKELVLEAVKTALLSTYKNYDVSIDILAGTGEIKAYAHKTVVKTPEDEWREIGLKDAKKIQKAIKLGEVLDIEIDPLNAGRIGAQTAKQVVMQRLREAEHEFIFGTFAHKSGEVLSGVIQRVDPRQILVDLGQAEGLLPISEQVRAENYRPGQRLKVYLVEVSQTTRGPRLLLSRTHPKLVQRLFELEVPEIRNDIISIKAIAREAGSRTKIAVSSTQEKVDPVGSCIGLRGIRIQNVTNEIQGEKIDIFEWDSDPKILIANALSPARVSQVQLDPLEATALVMVPDSQLSLAIGREGQNARLAAKLTDWKVDIKSVSAAMEEGLLIEEKPVIVEVKEVKKPSKSIEEPDEIEGEELVLDTPVVAAEPPPEGGIRFAEDLLSSPKIEEELTSTDKSNKKKTKTKGTAKAKPKPKKVYEDEDELDFDLDDDDDFDPDMEEEDVE